MNLLQNFVYSFGLNNNQLDNFKQSYPAQQLASFSTVDIQTDQQILTNQNNKRMDILNLNESSHSNSFNFSSMGTKTHLNDTFFANIENKRVRNMFTATQIAILEKVFEQTHYPDSSIREQLSSRFNLNSMRIQVWFQNRRAKYRKMDSEPRKFTYNQKKFKISKSKEENLSFKQSSSSKNLNHIPEAHLSCKSTHITRPIPQYFGHFQNSYPNQNNF